MIVDETTEEDDAKDEMSEIEDEKVKVRGRLGPKDGFGYAIDPGRTNQDGADTRPGVDFVRYKDVCAGREPNKRLDECDERERDGAPDWDCGVGGGVVWDGLASLEGLCLAESEKLVQGRPECAAEFPEAGGEGQRDGEETEGGDEEGGGERGPGCADARVGEVERTRPGAELEAVHEQEATRSTLADVGTAIGRNPGNLPDCC